MNYKEWEEAVPQAFTKDSLWKMTAYRLALFIGDIGWFDVSKLIQDRRTLALADQLYDALGSISANLAEGYSRGTSRDRARFYEYALGSARESRDWYFKGRYILGEAIVQHRLELLSEIIRLLLTMVPQQRGQILREEELSYQINSADEQSNSFMNNLDLENLLQNVPITDL
jgi:four helix bundle protein